MITEAQVAGAVYRFAASLAQEPEALTVGQHHDAAPLAQLVRKFLADELGPEFTGDVDFSLIKPKLIGTTR